jgi:hypothetical protein
MVENEIPISPAASSVLKIRFDVSMHFCIKNEMCVSGQPPNDRINSWKVLQCFEEKSL